MGMEFVYFIPRQNISCRNEFVVAESLFYYISCTNRDTGYHSTPPPPFFRLGPQELIVKSGSTGQAIDLSYSMILFHCYCKRTHSTTDTSTYSATSDISNVKKKIKKNSFRTVNVHCVVYIHS